MPFVGIYRKLEAEKVAPERYFHSAVVQLGKTLFLRYTDKSIWFIEISTNLRNIDNFNLCTYPARDHFMCLTKGTILMSVRIDASNNKPATCIIHA